MQENKYKICSDSIKRLRYELILSQDAFAKALDVSYATISGWETGRRSPNYRSIRKMIDLAKQNNIQFQV